MLEWGAYGGSKRWSFGVEPTGFGVTRMVVPFTGTSRKSVRGVYDGLRGRFFGGSTTGVTNVRKIKGNSFKIIDWNGCYGRWATVYV